MSNKTDLQTLNSNYSALIEELRGKAVGGGSGGSVETCTVEVTVDSDAKLREYAITTIDEGGNLVMKKEDYTLSNAPSNTTLTFENILCGSIMFFAFDGTSTYISSDLFWRSLFYSAGYCVLAPTTSGTVGKVTLIGDE